MGQEDVVDGEIPVHDGWGLLVQEEERQRHVQENRNLYVVGHVFVVL